MNELFFLIGIIIGLLLIRCLQHKQLMRLLSDLATMVGDGIDVIVEGQ